MLKKTLVCAVLTVMSHAALAATNVELKVSGNIAPVACDVNLGNGGTIDYGNISPDLLSDTAVTKLVEKQLPLEISCEAPIRFGIKTTTRRPNTGYGGVAYPNGNNGYFEGSMMGQVYFHGLGLSDNSKKIGGYAMITDTKNTTADGKKVAGLRKHPDESAWKANNDGELIWSNTLLHSWAEEKKSEPLPIKSLNTTLRVQAYIALKNEFDFSKPIKLNGMSSIELVYL